MIESLQERNVGCRDWIDMIIQATPAAATVLVVEDDFLVRLCAADALSEAGFNVLEADSGPAALRILEDEPVDIVFTDINMPGAFDGAGLARRVRNRWPATAVVITSGRGCPDEDLGQALFLPKPYMPDSLSRTIEEVLGFHAGHEDAGKIRCLAG
jgi:two-component system, response regulator PdtaR